MNKVLFVVFVLFIGCEITDIDMDVDDERLSKEERMELLRDKYPENTHKVPEAAPYEFNINTGLRFIK